MSSKTSDKVSRTKEAVLEALRSEAASCPENPEWQRTRWILSWEKKSELGLTHSDVSSVGRACLLLWEEGLIERKGKGGTHEWRYITPVMKSSRESETVARMTRKQAADQVETALRDRGIGFHRDHNDAFVVQPEALAPLLGVKLS